MPVIIKDQIHKWVQILLFNLLIVASAGLFLRLMMVFPVPHTNFKYFLHAHSHFAFYGWGFIALFIAFFASFIPPGAQGKKAYRQLFIIGLIAAYGMLCSFPFRGYAMVSICFSTLSILVSYWFAWRFYKDTAGNSTYGISIQFARAAVFFLLISSLGPFAMGPLMVYGGEGKPIYYNAIYFYLHFQYNGWFIFGVIGLFFRWMERLGIPYKKKTGRWIYWLMIWSSFPTFLLSVLWNNPNTIIYIIAGTGAVIQLAAVLPFRTLIRSCRPYLVQKLSPVTKVIGKIVIILFVLKLLFQFLASFPLIVRWTVQVRPLVIGYLHLVLLGVFTLFFLAWLIQKRLLRINSMTYSGLLCFLTGIFLTESLLFTESLLMFSNRYFAGFNQWMFASTILLPAGAAILFWGNKTARHTPGFLQHMRVRRPVNPRELSVSE